MIKLLEKHPEYFKTLNIPSNKRAIMIVTDGNYNEFIDKLSNSKIFSKDFEEKEFISNSIDKIINCNKFKKEIDDYQQQIDDLKKLKEESYKKIEDFIKKNDLIEIKKNYSNLRNKNFNLKSRTINLLKILKSSNIPFILCYFPKIGGEFNYDLFKGKAIFLEKAKTKFNYYQYKFIVNDNEQYLNNNYVSKKDFDDAVKQIDNLKKELDDLRFLKNLVLKYHPEILKELETKKNESKNEN